MLPLADEKGATGTCVTRFPRDILPNLGALDFRLDQFTVPDLGAEDVRQCLVGGPSSQPYETMDRATFLSSFFDELGVLDIRNHDSLKNDPGFIKRAHDLGFFPYQGGYTGYLQLRLSRRTTTGPERDRTSGPFFLAASAWQLVCAGVRRKMRALPL